MFGVYLIVPKEYYLVAYSVDRATLFEINPQKPVSRKVFGRILKREAG